MIITLSPAKLYDFIEPPFSLDYSTPKYQKEASLLNNLLKPLTTDNIEELMEINPNLAINTYEYIHKFELPNQIEHPALFSYNGMAYHGLDASTLSKDDIAFAEKHLVILSGLYGVLKPLDKINPYRLEMQTKLTNPEGKDLYDFWRDKITSTLLDYMQLTDSNIWINLTSKEYAKVVDKKKLPKGTEIINPVFKESTGTGYKQIVVYVKKARGMMARYIIENKITNTEDIKGFNYEGYFFSEELSSKKEWVFIR